MRIAAAMLVLGCLVPALAQGPQELRDPFVYLLRAPEPPRVVRPHMEAESKPHGEPVTPTPSQAVQPTGTPKPAAPAVTVTGIVSGPAQTAILSNAGRSFVVRVGDRMGDYRVSAIGPRSVTLATGTSKFKLPLE